MQRGNAPIGLGDVAVIIHAPRPLDEFTARGLLQIVERAEGVLRALVDTGNGDVEVRIGTPGYRCPVAAAVIREALLRRIDEACATLSRRRLRL